MRMLPSDLPSYQQSINANSAPQETHDLPASRSGSTIYTLSIYYDLNAVLNPQVFEQYKPDAPMYIEFSSKPLKWSIYPPPPGMEKESAKGAIPKNTRTLLIRYVCKYFRNLNIICHLSYFENLKKKHLIYHGSQSFCSSRIRLFTRDEVSGNICLHIELEKFRTNITRFCHLTSKATGEVTSGIESRAYTLVVKYTKKSVIRGAASNDTCSDTAFTFTNRPVSTTMYHGDNLLSHEVLFTPDDNDDLFTVVYKGSDRDEIRDAEERIILFGPETKKLYEFGGSMVLYKGASSFNGSLDVDKISVDLENSEVSLYSHIVSDCFSKRKACKCLGLPK